MKNLRNVSVLFSALLIGFSFLAQNTVQPAFLVKYGEEAGLHSRAIKSYKKNLYIAASDGKLYTYNAKDASIAISDETEGIEYRDIVVNCKNIVLLASGDSSATLSRPRKIGKAKFTPFPDHFLDGIAYGKKTLFMMGDPIDGKFNLLVSHDYGWHWEKVVNAPTAMKGEAGFAASGTNVRMLSDKEWLFVSGGMASKLYRTKDAGLTWTETDMGFNSCASCGAYSFALLPNNTIIAVGGDYTQADEKAGTCRISNDGGLTWHAPKVKLNGYRSNVIYHKGILYACGTNGIDYSQDNGETWLPFSYGNYFTMTIFRKQLVASASHGNVYFFDLKKK